MQYKLLLFQPKNLKKYQRYIRTGYGQFLNLGKLSFFLNKFSKNSGEQTIASRNMVIIFISFQMFIFVSKIVTDSLLLLFWPPEFFKKLVGKFYQKRDHYFEKFLKRDRVRSPETVNLGCWVYFGGFPPNIPDFIVYLSLLYRYGLTYYIVLY